MWSRSQRISACTNWITNVPAQEVSSETHGSAWRGPVDACTYSCLRASTCSMVVTPARAKLSLYWLILMDSSHSGTDRNVVPSQPLVLGRRMETLRSQSPDWLVVHGTWFCLGSFPPERCCDCSYRGSKSAMVFNDSGLRSSLSKKLTMSEKRGRLDRSCCQHWSISW